MNRWAIVAAVAMAASPVGLIAIAVVMMLALAGSPSSETSATTSASCGATVDPTTTAAGLDPEQVANVQVFIAEGKRRGLEPKAWIAAVAAGKVESQMRNLPYGDGTSIGVLQLIDDHGFTAQRLDPLFSVSWFYSGVQRFKAPTYTEMPVGALAQRQQRSAFPFRYSEEEAWATAVVSALEDGATPAACAPLASGPWTSPVAVGAFRLSSDFGPRSSPGGIGSTNHSGLDFAAPDGTMIYAASAGRVVAAGSAGGYGNLVRLAHADGVETYYAHQSRVSVTVGDIVEPGTPIGFVGSTGNSTGNHLHFEVRISGTPTDPYPWLAEHDVPLEAAA